MKPPGQATAPPSPFLRPLVVAFGVMLFYCLRRVFLGQGVNAAQVAVIGAWFLIAAVLTAFASMLLKKEFNWTVASGSVLGLAMTVALLMLGLKQAGLIYHQ
jgi:uncharacterized membrane protein HdeD (DUF308 family)